MPPKPAPPGPHSQRKQTTLALLQKNRKVAVFVLACAIFIGVVFRGPQAEFAFGSADARAYVESSNKTWFQAAREGNLKLVKAHIAAGADVNTTVETDMSGVMVNITALHAAAAGNTTNHVKVVQLLLQAGCNANAHSSSGATPLHVAAMAGSIDIAQVLLQHGADVNASSGDPPRGGTPLNFAAGRGNMDFVRWALQQGAALTWPDLYNAVLNNHTEMVGLMLRSGADVNAATPFNYSSLHSSARNNFIDITRQLIHSGANVNLQDDAGETPLILATRHGHIDAARMLIAAGADVNLKNKHGHTPLFLAVQMAQHHLADLIRSHGGSE
jgi:ankyrin repeat protein